MFRHLKIGHDTTASGVSWTLYSLAELPEYQVKCQQEIDQVLHDRRSDELSWSVFKYLIIQILTHTFNYSSLNLSNAII